MPPAPILSYCGPPPLPAELWQRWTLDPGLLLALAAAALVAARLGRGLSRRRRMALWGGLGVAALAFVTPLCALSVALFAARAGQHMLLVLVAAPLLALGLPDRRVWLPGSAALALFAGLFWLWHLPVPYDAALRDGWLYWASHLTLLAAAVPLWRHLLRGGSAGSLMLGAAASAQMGLLGAVLVFAPAPLYASHLATAPAWGLSALHDQQLGGLLMWVPGGLGFLAVGLWGVVRLARQPVPTRAA